MRILWGIWPFSFTPNKIGMFFEDNFFGADDAITIEHVGGSEGRDTMAIVRSSLRPIKSDLYKGIYLSGLRVYAITTHTASLHHEKYRSEWEGRGDIERRFRAGITIIQEASYVSSASRDSLNVNKYVQEH